MPNGLLFGFGSGNSLTVPLELILPIVFPDSLSPHAPLTDVRVYQRLPSGPLVMSYGLAPVAGSGNSVIEPSVVIRPILFAPQSVNQRAFVGPAVIS